MGKFPVHQSENLSKLTTTSGDLSSVMEAIRARTPARILVGRSGPAYRTMRKIFGLKPAPEFLAWLEEREIFKNHQLAIGSNLPRRLLLEQLRPVLSWIPENLAGSSRSD